MVDKEVYSFDQVLLLSLAGKSCNILKLEFVSNKLVLYLFFEQKLKEKNKPITFVQDSSNHHKTEFNV